MADYQALVETIAKGLVTNPDAVSVTCDEQAGNLLVTLQVAKEDMGRVIGRRGTTVHAIRTLVRAAGNKAGQLVTLEILD